MHSGVTRSMPHPSQDMMDVLTHAGVKKSSSCIIVLSHYCINGHVISFPHIDHELLGQRQKKAVLQREDFSKGVEDPKQQGTAPDFAGTAVLKMQALL